MAKEEKDAAAAEKSPFAERMQDVSGMRIIKGKDGASVGFMQRLTDGAGMKVVKKKEDNTK